LQNAFNLFLAGPNRGIGAVLSALSSTGLSQMLAEPTLIVRSGEQAHFLAGGEIPIPVPQNAGGTGGGTISIEYKEFGVRLSVAPFVLSNGRIVMKIAPEVSELDYANGVQLQGYNVPGIRRRSAETTVQLASGQSFVIAGLNYTNSTVNKEKMPFLGDLPVIGAFFKRQQNQKERQELIIVATPRLVGPMEAGTMPALPGIGENAPDPSIGDMILGTDGIEQRSRPFGVVRR
jgi:pilus assembly protein CpaC